VLAEQKAATKNPLFLHHLDGHAGTAGSLIASMQSIQSGKANLAVNGD
jgi:hypothetical protein